MFGFLNAEGSLVDNATRVSCANYLKYNRDVIPTLSDGWACVICFYNDDYTMKSRTLLSSVAAKSFIIPTNTKFRFSIWDNDGGTKPEDINDWSKNFTLTTESVIESIEDRICVLEYEGCSLSMFDSVGVCGDSYTAGAIFTTNGTVIGDNEKTSWGKCLGRLSGIDVGVYAKGGATIKSWLVDCLPKLLADNARELYVIALGINDISSMMLGTISDIHEDYTENPDTYYGCYGKIITQIKNHAPNAKIILSTTLIPTWRNGVYYTWSRDAIEKIANHFNIGFIDTMNSGFMKSALYNNNIVGGHPTAPLYSGIANSMAKLIEKCMNDNIEYFMDYYPN